MQRSVQRLQRGYWHLISECQRHCFNEAKDTGETGGIIGMQAFIVSKQSLFLHPSTRWSTKWYRVGTVVDLSLTVLEWTHALPRNIQASKAAYTEEAASRQGYGGSCNTPLVRDAALLDSDRAGLGVAVTYRNMHQWFMPRVLAFRSETTRIFAFRNASENHPVVVS